MRVHSQQEQSFNSYRFWWPDLQHSRIKRRLSYSRNVFRAPPSWRKRKEGWGHILQQSRSIISGKRAGKWIWHRTHQYCKTDTNIPKDSSAKLVLLTGFPNWTQYTFKWTSNDNLTRVYIHLPVSVPDPVKTTVVVSIPVEILHVLGSFRTSEWSNA